MNSVGEHQTYVHFNGHFARCESRQALHGGPRGIPTGQSSAGYCGNDSATISYAEPAEGWQPAVRIVDVRHIHCFQYDSQLIGELEPDGKLSHAANLLRRLDLDREPHRGGYLGQGRD